MHGEDKCCHPPCHIANFNSPRYFNQWNENHVVAGHHANFTRMAMLLVTATLPLMLQLPCAQLKRTGSGWRKQSVIIVHQPLVVINRWWRIKS